MPLNRRNNIMISNRYAKKCKSCGVYVDVGDGFAYNDGVRWNTVCASKACHRRLGVNNATMAKKVNNVKELTTDGMVIMGYDPEALPLIRSMPGARWNPDNKYWTVSTKSADLDRVIELAEKIGLEISDELVKKSKAGTVESNEAVARIEKITESGKSLFPFQKIGVRFLSLKDRALLGDDMGVGKTIQALVAVPDMSRCLVICPASVKYNWRDEASIWRPEFSVKVIKGKNNFVLPEEGEIVIANYDILPKWMSPTKDSGRTTRKGEPILVADLTDEQRQILSETVLICDEAHRVKNYNSNRSKKIGQISRIVQKCWFLTGTPLMNRPMDLFGVLASGGMNPLGGWYKFVELFNGYKNDWGGYEFGMPSGEVAERMKRVMLRRMKSEVLPELPPKTYQRVEIDDIGREAKKALDKYSMGQAEYEGVKGKKVTDIVDGLDLSDIPDFEEFSRVRAMIAESRIPAMLDTVDQYEEEGVPLVVFSAHRNPIDTLEHRDGWDVITGSVDPEKRRSIVRRFQNGELKGLGLTISAGGEGITLTNASHALFVDLDWTPALNIQAEDRICRIGQTSKAVVIKRMVSSHPLDLHVQKLLEYKIDLAYKALDTSIEYKKKEVKDTNSNIAELVDETDEELLARLKEADQKVNRDMALDKIHSIASREYERVVDVPMPDLTTDRKDMLRAALDYMTSMCDGAVLKDGKGFNRPDACIGHWMQATGLRDEDEEAFRVLECILYRYKRQLGNKFDEIWVPKIAV